MSRKTVLLKHAKTGCFAYRDEGTCGATTKQSCKKCKFYKTKSQFASEQKKTEKRISNVFKVPYNKFVVTKGLVK